MSLSAAQEAAIAAGKPVRQEFYVIRPEDAAHSAYETYLFDAGTYGDGTLRRVTNPGTRKWLVANVSPTQPGRLQATKWTIEVDNIDGAFLYKAGSLFEHSTTAYLAYPQECFLEHRAYVRVAGAWSELTDVRYKGRIRDVQYEDAENAAGTLVPLKASISTEDAGAFEVLRRPFVQSDAVDEQVDIPGGGDPAYWVVT